jgi:hypothetical protein
MYGTVQWLECLVLNDICQFECETLRRMPEKAIVAYSKIRMTLHLKRWLASRIICIK